MRNAGLDEAQTGIKIARRNINNLRYVDDNTLIAESEEEVKTLLEINTLLVNIIGQGDKNSESLFEGM